MSYMTVNVLPQSPSNRVDLLMRIFSISGKIKNHMIHDDVDCKIMAWVDILIKYEKDNNHQLNLQEILNEEFVEKVLFSDELMFIL